MLLSHVFLHHFSGGNHHSLTDRALFHRHQLVCRHLALGPSMHGFGVGVQLLPGGKDFHRTLAAVEEPLCCLMRRQCGRWQHGLLKHVVEDAAAAAATRGAAVALKDWLDLVAVLVATFVV